MHFHNKLIIVYLITIIIPIISLCFYFFYETEDLIMKQVDDSYRRVLAGQSEGINYNIKMYESIADFVVAVPLIQDILQDKHNKYSYNNIIKVNNEVKEALQYVIAYHSRDIEKVELYKIGDLGSYVGGYIFPLDKLLLSVNEYELPEHSSKWFIEYNHYLKRDTYALVKPIYSLSNFEKIGYIKLSINIPDVISEEVETEDKADRLVVINNKGKYIYHRDFDYIGKMVSEEFLKQGSGSVRFFARKDSKEKDDYLIWKQPLSNPKWYSVLYIPKSSIEGKVNKIKYMIVLMGILCILIFSLAMFFIIRKMTYKLRRLHNKVHNVSQGSLYSNSPADCGSDEIAVLDRNFEQMLANLRNLIHENYVEKLDRREIELKFLQAQINPHFLYNTLDSIKNEIDMEEQDNAVDMVIALADLFRISVSRGKELIRWEEEIHHAESYLKILNIRFGDKYQIHWDISKEVRTLYTLKIILQPIIENAIKHGLQDMDEGMIYIQGKIEDKFVVITIKDNGKGMSEKKLQSITFQHKGNENRGIGLRNVHDRIKMYFGNEYGMEISAIEGKGTKVTFILPILRGVDDVPVANC